MIDCLFEIISIFEVFLPLLRKAASFNSSLPIGVNRAAIVNISSGAASIQDNKSGGVVIYRASKVGLYSPPPIFSKILSINECEMIYFRQR